MCGPCQGRCPKELPIPLNSAIEPRARPRRLTAEPAPKACGLARCASTWSCSRSDPHRSSGGARRCAAPERDLFFVGAETDLASAPAPSSAASSCSTRRRPSARSRQLTQSLKVAVPGPRADRRRRCRRAVGAHHTGQQAARSIDSCTSPPSEQRVRLFIDAAWRRRDAGDRGPRQRRCRSSAGHPAPSHCRSVSGHGGPSGRRAAGIVGWLMGHHGSENLPVAAAPAPAVTPPQRRIRPAPQAGHGYVLKDLLARADAALARGDWLHAGRQQRRGPLSPGARAPSGRCAQALAGSTRSLISCFRPPSRICSRSISTRRST